MMNPLLQLAIFFSICCTLTSAIMFKLEPNTQKCLIIDYVVRDTRGHILSQKEQISKGKFSFTSETFETYEICFISRVPLHIRGFVQEVSLITKKGIDTKSYEGIGEAAKLKPLEVDLKRLEDLSDSIVQDFVYMRKQEEEMRDTNEWEKEWTGPQIIVEVSEKSTNATDIDVGPKIIVRTEEVLIVVAVLLLWIGAIALFFNRWGKIRMLEPYQPKFQQQHRSSCPLVELEPVPPHKHPSFSRISMGMSLQIPPGRLGSISGAPSSNLYSVRASPLYSRNRQNSVFVGPQIVTQKPSRKYQSAMDIHSMVLDEAPEPV